MTLTKQAHRDAALELLAAVTWNQGKTVTSYGPGGHGNGTDSWVGNTIAAAQVHATLALTAPDEDPPAAITTAAPMAWPACTTCGAEEGEPRGPRRVTRPDGRCAPCPDCLPTHHSLDPQGQR